MSPRDRTFEHILDDVRRIELEPVASECDLYGHDYHVHEYIGRDANGPEKVMCYRCGLSWKVER